MSSKIKIGFGFGIIVLVTLTLAFFSYNASRHTLADLGSYARINNADVLTYQIEVNMYKLNNHLDLFIRNNKSEDKNIVLETIDRSIAAYQELGANMDKDNLSTINETISNLQNYKSILSKLISDTTTFYELYNTQFLPSHDAFMKSLQSVVSAAVNQNDTWLMKLTYETVNEATLVSENMLSFLLSQNAVFLEDISNSEKQVSAKIKEISMLQSAALDGYTLENLNKTYKKFDDLSVSLHEFGENIVANRENMPVPQNLITENTIELSRIASEQSKNTLSSVVNRTKSDTNTNVTFSIVAVLLCIAIAIYIIVSLRSTFNKMAAFAKNIANGKFNSESHITEGAEIGDVVNSIGDIARVFSDIIESCKKTANEVSSGYFEARMDEELFKGDFKNLAKVINIVADSYTDHIEKMPSGIFTANPDGTIIYMNNASKKMVNQENVVGVNCSSLFNADTCASHSTCLGRQSIARKGLYNNEAICLTASGKVTIDVSAAPLYDLDGNIVAYMEILNDVSQIKRQTQAIQDMTSQASDVALRVASATEELSSQTDSIVHGSNSQRERIESTTAAITEMNSSVIEVAQSASLTAEQSETARQKAKDGIATLRNMTQSMSSLTSSSEKLKNNMSQLDELAEGIDSIINVISDIADQTNLLALNAAIEAARAGDAGRGFAVVADEVRKLAEKTMDATSKVDESIRAIQVSSRANQQEVSSVVGYVTNTAELARESESSLQEIVNLTGQTSEMINSISIAAQEQKNVSNEIAHAMSDINDTVNNTSEAILQSAEAIRELTVQAQDLQDLIAKANK